MMKYYLKVLLLTLLLMLPLSTGFAAEDCDEEITLPVGSIFDLGIPEICGYEIDQQMVTMRKDYGREMPMLNKLGDTVITVLIKIDDNSRLRMNVLVHVISQEQFMNGDNEDTASSSKEKAQ